MSPVAGRPRGARTAAVAVGLLVLVLVAVLVGLLQPSAPPSSEPTPAARPTPPATSAASPTTSARDPETGLGLVALDDLPAQARRTVALIDAGGPFPYAQDGATFRNDARRLPSEPRGYYREYTVRTPGESDRGARRIVTGDDDRQLFYTADHYASFVRVSR